MVSIFRAARAPSVLSSSVATAVFAFALAGCGESDDGDVRLVNATSDFSALDLEQSGDTLASKVASFAASGYQGLDPGSVTFDVKGSDAGSIAASVAGTVVKGEHYAVVTTVSGGAVQATVLDENASAPDGGRAKLRLFNAASAEAGDLDVYVTASDCDALASSDTPVASALSGLAADYHEVTAASSGTAWHVCVTGSGDRTDLRLDIPSLTLRSGEIATLVLTRTAGGVLVDGALLEQQGALERHANTQARVRLVADAASAGTVSATLGSTALGSAVASPGIGSYRLVTAGVQALTLAIAGSTVSGSDLTTTAGGDYTLLVAGDAGAPTIALLADDNTPSTSTALPAKLRLVNGVNGSAGGATLTADGVVAGDGVAFGAASAATDVAATTATSTLQATSSGTTLWQATDQTLASGKVYTVFLLGDTGTPTGTLRADR